MNNNNKILSEEKLEEAKEKLLKRWEPLIVSRVKKTASKIYSLSIEDCIQNAKTNILNKMLPNTLTVYYNDTVDKFDNIEKVINGEVLSSSYITNCIQDAIQRELEAEGALKVPYTSTRFGDECSEARKQATACALKAPVRLDKELSKPIYNHSKKRNAATTVADLISEDMVEFVTSKGGYQALTINRTVCLNDNKIYNKLALENEQNSFYRALHDMLGEEDFENLKKSLISKAKDVNIYQRNKAYKKIKENAKLLEQLKNIVAMQQEM